MANESPVQQLPPEFGLYGESALPLDPGYVHIEDIASRSRQLGWHIRPHRHANLFQVLHLVDGEMEMHLENRVLRLTGHHTITLPVGVIHGFRFQPNTNGKILSIATDLLESPTYSRHFRPLLSQPHHLTWQDQPESHQRVACELDDLQLELDNTLPGFEATMEWQVGKLMMLLSRGLRHQHHLKHLDAEHPSRIAARFQELVERHYAEHIEVARYAELLHVSQSSLNRHCQSSLGATAKAVIQNRIIREAKRRLVYTQNPVEQIGYTLGFKDPAYFSRFFQRNVGASPAAYRREYSRRGS